MRSSLVKKLRREAERRTPGMPLVVYSRDSKGTIAMGKCTRKLYKLLKTGRVPSVKVEEGNVVKEQI